jgi:preprotein translocase subunit SecG
MNKIFAILITIFFTLSLAATALADGPPDRAEHQLLVDTIRRLASGEWAD